MSKLTFNITNISPVDHFEFEITSVENGLLEIENPPDPYFEAFILNKKYAVCLAAPVSSTTIQTSFNQLTHEMTVTGEVGTIVYTRDAALNILGTGTIGSGGTVTYFVDEQTLPNQSLIYTSAINSNIVENTITTSSKFLYENIPAGFAGSITTWMDDAPINGSLFVDWGDGSPPQIISFVEADDNWGEYYEHIYQNPGSYVIKYRAIGYWNGITVQDHHKLLDWGNPVNYSIQNSSAVFYEVVPDNLPTYMTSCYNLFYACNIFNQDISHWDTQYITDMRNMFRYCYAFNQNISTWCVPNILSEPYMFSAGSPLIESYKPRWGTCPIQPPQAIPFEATIKNAYPTDPYQFYGGYSWFSGENPTLIVDWGDGSPIQVITDGNSFNHNYTVAQEYYNIKLWLGTTRLKELYVYDAETIHTFGDAEIAAFILDSEFLIQVPSQLPAYVTGTYSMFKNCTIFNGNISQWNTVNVTNMNNMFEWAVAFNQNISNWNVSNVGKFGSHLGMSSMLRNASAFNQNLSGWCVTYLPNEPENFNLNGLLTNDKKPVWGTCPLG